MSIPLQFLLIISTLSAIINPSLSDPRTTQAALICANSTASRSDRNPFVPNFLAALDSLTPQISSHRYGTAITGAGNTTTSVFAYGECMKDLSKRDCDLCFAQCKTQILRCLPFQQLTRGGRLFYDGCYLRYDKYMFFNESLTSVSRTVCRNQSYSGRNRGLFRRNVGELVRNLSFEGVRNNGFAVGVVGRGNLSVYGLAQCWEFVNRSSCEKCLADCVNKIEGCFDMNMIEGRVLNSGCYMRYSLQKFYDNSTDEDNHGHEDSHHLAIALASAFGALALVLFILAASFLAWRRILRQRREKKLLGALLATINKSRLNFSYESLERATDYFHVSNKLGQGGSGSVYKGVLPDGRNIAVKRLMYNTRQWADHFFNEVNLISNIDHKNLVKLLGCSITGPESLLVYEFVPNQSLHDHLFGRKKGRPLSWEERYKIILGTAEGLAYLHDGTKLRIIHRDIKLSNVLLDGQYLPKIADFGLARLFPEDKTHISTAIAGTLGYMAPEYVVHGKLTEKADVYSFGVLLVEVISGQRNNSFTQNPNSILQIVWTLYEDGRIHEAVDPTMNKVFRQEEASRLLRIGLLCAQASAELRPSMSYVVKMLSDNNEEIPCPTQPPFLNTGSSEFPNPLFTRPVTNSSGNSNSLSESWIDAR